MLWINAIYTSIFLYKGSLNFANILKQVIHVFLQIRVYGFRKPKMMVNWVTWNRFQFLMKFSAAAPWLIYKSPNYLSIIIPHIFYKQELVNCIL